MPLSNIEIFLLTVVMLYIIYLQYGLWELKKKYNHCQFLLRQILTGSQETFNEISKMYKHAKEVNEKLEG